MRKTQQAKSACKLAVGCLIFAYCAWPSLTICQSSIEIGGIVTANYLDSQDSRSQFRYNNGLPGFELLADLFLNVRISDEASAFLELETWRGWEARVYTAALTYKISGDRLQIEAGKFAAPFGNFLPRRFAPQNFVYGHPLFYEYRTALSTGQFLPDPRALLLARRGASRDAGLQMLARNAYFTGARFFGKLGAVGYHLGFANGAPSNPVYVNENKRMMIFGRLHLQPVIGLTLGVSAANGGYLNNAVVKSAHPDLKPEQYAQTLAGADVEYSRGYFVFFGESVWSRWESPFITDPLEALAFSAELRYKILPRLFVAGRYGRLQFSEIADAGDLDADGRLSEPWEFPVWRFESAIGYNLSRHALVKAVWQINRTGANDPADDLAVLQMTVFY
ncbi:MAG: hypothetical protein ONB46_08940 [candidate division KSB1 bacterium]|nr:hypothetical protein [candidate division KSB1 bacterium]MDZ7365850.1 hypothetical protein [candidate division KSB1 bacterium]MDZ7403915.1 hypothetical protein [candidate division KSB1 bacterium]